jgi:alkanesulfonate monooxygenase SsuD/methylene tetrahydromethanopterin reductase-like flavin-dependent oxidoreductase (luciferase family)
MPVQQPIPVWIGAQSPPAYRRAGRLADGWFPHRWTPGCVTAEADFTGAHLLHLAAASCVVNDLYWEAAALGIELKGVRVIAAGGFDTAT